MGRSVFTTINRFSREADRAARARQRAQERSIREHARLTKLQDKESKANYLEARLAEVEAANAEINTTVSCLQSILISALKTDPTVDFRQFLRHPTEADLPKNASLTIPAMPLLGEFLPEPPNWFARIFAFFRNRHAEAVTRGQQLFNDQKAIYEGAVSRRRAAMAALQADADEHNGQVQAVKDALIANDPEAIRYYFELVLEQSKYPDEFPKHTRVAFGHEFEATRV